MDPKTLATLGAIATPILGAIGLFLWGRGKAAGLAAADQVLADLHDEEVAAAKTKGTEDDERVRAKIAMVKAARAALAAA